MTNIQSHPHSSTVSGGAQSEEEAINSQFHSRSAEVRADARVAESGSGPGCVAVHVGERLFQFNSMNDWINHAQRIWKLHGVDSRVTVCIDARGRIVTSGGHFRIAEEDDAYPIVVYIARADMHRPSMAPERVGRRIGAILKQEAEL